MYSFPNLDPICCSMSCSKCCTLTCIQVSQEAREVVWYFHLFENFPQFAVIHTVKSFYHSQWSRGRCFSVILYDPMDVGNLISGSSDFSKSSLNIWKFLVHVLLNPSLENFEHYFASEWDKYNWSVVSTLFGTALLWDWNKNWSFPVLWPLLCFPNLLAYWVKHFNSIIF